MVFYFSLSFFTPFLRAADSTKPTPAPKDKPIAILFVKIPMQSPIPAPKINPNTIYFTRKFFEVFSDFKFENRKYFLANFL